MASTLDIVGRNDTTLWAAGCLLEDIHDRAPDWKERPEGEWADFFYESEAIVGRLHGAVEDDAAGTLTTEQQQRLRELAQRLVEARDVIRSIGLDYPDLGHILAESQIPADEHIAHEIVAIRHWAGRLRTAADFRESPLLEDRERQDLPRDWNDVIERFAKGEALAGRCRSPGGPTPTRSGSANPGSEPGGRGTRYSLRGCCSPSRRIFGRCRWK